MSIKTKKDNSSKRFKKNIIPIIAFLLGFLIFLYPIISRLYYRVETTKVVTDFTEGKKTIDQEELNRRFSLAKAYNASLSGNEEFHDPYVDNIEEGIKNYAHMLEYHEKIGIVRIPSINCEEPVYAGTSEEVLQHGVGHLEFTSLPIGGINTHCILTGHRGLPTAKLFSDLNKLKLRDVFYIENIKEIIAYEVDQIKIIEPNNFEDLYIVEGKDYCTLLTCHPYMINSHRLIVRGHRVAYNPDDLNAQLRRAKLKAMMIYALAGAAVVLAGTFVIVGIKRRRRKRRYGGRR